ncbi:hypothetical protein JCM33374_g3966 [Metschnikowia sp. JCM 33374]|nr:hypothetical protein JCM33374_g3966 [Metschnikowia sp. JCM 33374]
MMMVAAPLDIIRTPRKTKGLRFKTNRLSPSRSSPPHPLDSLDTEESCSESESDSFLESSYNESISSVATSETTCGCSSVTIGCCSWSPPNLRPVSLMPVVSTSCVATYSPKSQWSTPQTSSKLTELLRKSQNIGTAQSDPETKSTLPYAFPKSSKLSAWQAFSAFFINYSMRSGHQNDSGEGFPENNLISALQVPSKDSASSEVHKSKELETFKKNQAEAQVVVFNKSKARNREYRVNSEFLKRYAMDCSARLNGVLPGSPQDVAVIICRPSLRKFNSEYGLNKISEMSRDKLWNSVILPPRSDCCPRNVIDSDNYVLCQEETEKSSIISKYSSQLPWATHQNSMKPAGRLRTSACLKSKTSSTLGPSFPQYTVRGWQNERWTPISVMS